MKLNKILSAALAAGMIFSLAACGGDNGNSDKGNNSGMTKIILPDYDLKKDEYKLTISGWLIPSTLNETNVKWINESGISTLFAIGAGDGVQSFYSYDEKAEKTLTLLGNNGVKVYVNPGVSDGTAYRKMSEFKQSDAVLGICVDEPNKSQMTSMAAQVDWWNQNSDGRNFYSNLFPSFAQVVQKEFDGVYSDYLKFYCDNVLSKLTSGEKWLSADRYPLTYNENGEKCLDDNWLFDVQTLKKVANSYEGLKTNFFIQTMPYGIDEDGNASGAIYGSRDRVPSYEDIRMQEYALMAFGYDGISCFCYASPLIGFEFAASQEAMISRAGEKTNIYESVKKANGELLAFDHVLLQFDWIGTFTNDAGQTTTGKSRTSNTSFQMLTRLSLDSVPSLKEVTTSQDTLFGYFNDEDGNDGIMAVNYNETSLNLTDEIALTFDGSKYNKAVCYIGGEKVVKTLDKGKLDLTLGVGEGIFVIPYAD